MDKNKSKSLVDESIKQEVGFSSNMHGVAQDAHAPKYEYDIPTGYDIDRVMLMPVNLTTYHIYWEISDAFLHRLHLSKQMELSFKILDGAHNVLEEFFTTEKRAKRYINKSFDDTILEVVCGYYMGNRFITLLHSNRIKSFNSQIKLPDPKSEVWLSKQKGYSEIIRASLQHFTLGMSSASYVKQIERLSEYSKSKSYSSAALAKKGGDNE